MKKKFLFFAMMLNFGGFAQDNIQWASKVIGVSSERFSSKNGDAYKANQVLGRPNYVAEKREGFCAWTPAVSDLPSEEWIKVGFPQAQKAKQVLIAENWNAGTITKILVYDKNDVETLVFERQTDAPKEKPAPRLWHVPIADSTVNEIVAVKLVLNTALISDWNQIDAIGITSDSKPQELALNLTKITQAQDDNPKENLGKNVNSYAEELAPMIAPDGKTLYFTRDGHKENIGEKKEKAQDVWFSSWQAEGIWGEAQNIGEPINNEWNNAVISISADGKKIYLLNVFYPDGRSEKGLSSSYRGKLGWGKPIKVKIDSFKTNRDTQEFSMSPQGKVLMMTLENPQSVGEKDIFVSFKGKDDVWTTPKNIGSVVNTAEDETAPFIAPDNKTLYFTSKGHAGFGGGDIFMTKRLDSTWTAWSEPQNIGQAINTAELDAYLSIPASGEYAYFASEDRSIGASDIFRIKLFPAIKPEPVALISGVVNNLFDKKPIAANIRMEIMGDSLRESYDAEYNPETGEYKIIVPAKKNYSLIAQKDGFLSISDNIDLSKDNRYREIKKNISLAPIQAGQKIVLNNLNFEQSKYEILPQSFPELNRIAELMSSYKTMDVLLEGHTDNQGDVVLNVKLSENRVNEVKQYLVGKGIDEKRIQTKAWGGSKPLTSNVTEESRKKNRRVEFSILKL